MKISFVIPCYRSEHMIGKVMEEINVTMEGMPKYTYEVVLINDCSPDNTLSVIRKICAADKRIRGISFSRNYTMHRTCKIIH